MATTVGLCPVAEAAYTQIISLPIFPTLSDEKFLRIVDKLQEIL